MTTRLLPPFLIAAGVVLMLATLMLPGQARWVHDDPARYKHVTTLVATGDDVLLAGTQSGRLWRWDPDGQWRDMGGTPGELPITMLGHDTDILIGTPDGLYRPDGESILPTGRISHLHQHDAVLAIATGSSVVLRVDDTQRDWELAGPLDGAPVYRVQVQVLDEGVAWHAGTIGQGVWTLEPGEDSWQPNSDGLPDPVNILSMRAAGNNTLLAGTDQGLFWQAIPGQRWQRIDDGLGERRVLDLHREERDGRLDLFAASDDGLYNITLVERERSVETQGRWSAVAPRSAELDRSVGFVVSADDTLWISAGSVYRLARERGALWFVGLAVGLLLTLLGFRLMLTAR